MALRALGVKGDGGDVVFQCIGDEAHGCTLFVDVHQAKPARSTAR